MDRILAVRDAMLLSLKRGPLEVPQQPTATTAGDQQPAQQPAEAQAQQGQQGQQPGGQAQVEQPGGEGRAAEAAAESEQQAAEAQPLRPSSLGSAPAPAGAAGEGVEGQPPAVRPPPAAGDAEAAAFLPQERAAPGALLAEPDPGAGGEAAGPGASVHAATGVSAARGPAASGAAASTQQTGGDRSTSSTTIPDICDLEAEALQYQLPVPADKGGYCNWVLQLGTAT